MTLASANCRNLVENQEPIPSWLPSSTYGKPAIGKSGCSQCRHAPAAEMQTGSRMVDDASATISGLALRMLSDHGGDLAIVAVLHNSTRRRRRDFLSRLRSRKRFAAIDTFLESLLVAAGSSHGELLPFASGAVVVRQFASGEDHGGSLFWKRLGRYHPRIAIQAIIDRLAKTEAPDGLLLDRARGVLVQAGRAEPTLAVTLAKALAAHLPLSSLDVSRVISLRPTELAEVAVEAGQSTPFPLDNLAPRVETPLLIQLLRTYPGALPFSRHWFRKLAARERGLVFDEVGPSWRDTDGLPPAEALALLPAKQRLAEAERVAALPLLSTRPLIRGLYAAYLPWDQMRAIVDDLFNHPDGETRACGWTALTASVRYHRDQASAVLTMIRKRKFEQDPVRLAILQGLNSLPQSVWKHAHLDDVAGLIRESLDATDLSFSSAAYLTAFVQKLVSSFPEWSAKQLAVIYRERGNIGGYVLESRINNEQALVIEAAFIDVGIKWGKGNRVGWLVWFAEALGRRLRVCDRVRAALEKLLGRDSGYHHAAILELLRKHAPAAEFERLTKRLINAHESWVALHPIFNFLHRRHQDWLEPFLAKEKFKMKDGTKVELVHLLPSSGYRRYTAAQQQKLAATLSAIIKLPRRNAVPRDAWTMLRAMNFLVLLPAADPSRLLALSVDARPVIADAAIRALGRLDAAQGLPTLIAALGDSRARVAIYALRHAIAQMPTGRVMDALAKAPMNIVTVAKETIRLVGEFAGPAGFDWLRGLYGQQIHRDVRAAVLRGLWDHLEHPEAWELLSEAAGESDSQILDGVIRIPADRLSASSRRRLIALLIRLSKHENAVIRLAVFRRFALMPFPDDEGQVVAMAFPALVAPSPDERQAAAKSIAVNAQSRDAISVAQEIIAIRDRRRPLHDFLQLLIDYCEENAPGRRRLAPLAQALINGLRDDSATGGLRINLAATALGIGGFERELTDFQANQLLDVAILNEAAIAIDRIAKTAERSGLEQLEFRLSSSSDAKLRYLALSALMAQARDHMPLEREPTRAFVPLQKRSRPRRGHAGAVLFRGRQFRDINETILKQLRRSIWHAVLTGRLEGVCIPFQLVKESSRPLMIRRIVRSAFIVKGVLHDRYRQQRRDARHAQLAKHRPQLHGGSHAAKRAG